MIWIRKDWGISQLPFIRPAAIFSILFLHLPLATVFILSFNSSTDAMTWENFSIKWYKTIFENSDLLRAAKTSLAIALPAAIISSIFALGLAIGIGIAQSRIQKALITLINAPLVLPEIVTAVATLSLYSALSIPLNYFSLLAAHVTFCIPFAFLPIRSRLKDVDLYIFEAARDVGTSNSRTIIRITIPILLPAIASSLILTFIISMDDFLTSLFLSGPSTTTLPIYIFGLLKLGASPEINVIAALLLIIPTIVLIAGVLWRKER